jgi:dienelactone hydrolase
LNELSVPISHLETHARWLEPHLRVLTPPGEGPFPVVVQMHGCGGVHAMQTRYAEAAVEAGIAAVIVDSLAPRGIGAAQARLTVCTGLRLRGAERAGDLLAVLHWLEQQPWADNDRIAATGWSHGGWSIMEALAAPKPHPKVSSLKVVALFYPYAGPLARTAARGWGEHRPRVFACLAGRDSVVGTVGPLRAIGRLQADGLHVTLMKFAEATHAFDDDSPSADPRTHYREDLTESARRAYIAELIDAFALHGTAWPRATRPPP